MSVLCIFELSHMLMTNTLEQDHILDCLIFFVEFLYINILLLQIHIVRCERKMVSPRNFVVCVCKMNRLAIFVFGCIVICFISVTH